MPDIDYKGVIYPDVAGIELPQDGGGWALFTAGGGGKNIQYMMGRYETNSSSYVDTDLSLTVSKAGTYKCYWSQDRNTTSGTNGSRLYKGSAAQGTAHTSWTHNGNSCEETLTFSVGDVITIRARARNTSYYVGVSNLVIIEQ